MTAVLLKLKRANPVGWSADQWRSLASGVFFPALGLALFLLVWHAGAQQINTSLGTFPGPVQVLEQWNNLVEEQRQENERRHAFYERQEQRNAELLARNPDAEIRWREYRGRPTFFDQVVTSLVTVVSGFVLASAIAIPLGILIGLSQQVYRAINPLIQVFKPVSPLAWLPLVTLVVSAVYVSSDPMFSRSFLVSMITVTLCSLWPTLINTSVGVSNISKDLQNVSKVLRLNWVTHIRTIVIPSAIPMMFTGLRLSLGIAWMVLIAAEMLAQNPGLGKFVWDEFQNGSSDSLGRICVAVLVIGVIGFLLDRSMLLLQSWVNWDKNAIVR
ncbi:ABC transporter permease [Marinospirillum alkaliphilum]|uniref:Nitrate/nitrite transport system permease protein n=1 Tax=Marinospirillum alkaliphilum DSM 21637 TaxID=1122209 RepID=A0A1K1W3L7_9GAMM|nr:ABC transporter permease [Marinospirillum alkaliphilum]SFX31978.1 nitrate/nitrite transport system permease protein [Marinospirillum alkaliphilum DSM 21637]